MSSEYGFIGEVKHDADNRMYMQTHAITNVSWNEETTAFYEYNLSHGLKFYKLDNLFGAVMADKKVVISNNPGNDPTACGVPSTSPLLESPSSFGDPCFLTFSLPSRSEGHPPIRSFMGIPFLEQGTSNLVGMVGIANKPGGYTQQDVEFLEPFIVTCSNLIQIYNVIQENRRLINTLEDKVAERTRELSLANASLEAANRKVVAASAAQLNHFACMSHEIRYGFPPCAWWMQ
jgi:GAF domain